MIDVMIDLETLGTQPGSVVLSIGAASCKGGFLWTINPMSCLRAGLTIDPDTLIWWRKQSEEAWHASTCGTADLTQALTELSKWLMSLRSGSSETKTGEPLRVWGDGASFDLVLLGCAYRACGIPVPWSYREEHCYRTLRQLAKSDKPVSKVQHDALSDAQAQLAHLQSLLHD